MGMRCGMTTLKTADPSASGNGAGTKVEPEDYATLNAVYAALLAAVVIATRDRASEDPVRASELLPLGAATFAVSKVVAREKIGTWVREPFVDDASHGGQPRGRRFERALGELVTCSRCVGAWSALGVVGLRVASPPAGKLVASVLATSAVNDWMQAGFAWLRARANAAGA
jgi:Protein of unknown function (DUF1360)